MLSTTDTPLDTLEFHKAIKESGWKGRVLPTFRPDAVIDAEYAGFVQNIEKLGEITGEDIGSYKGYLNALRNRRAFFKSMGATATDHGHLTARTADLDAATAESLYGRILSGRSVPEEQEYLPGADADRNGWDERGRRVDDANSSRLGAEPQ